MTRPDKQTFIKFLDEIELALNINVPYRVVTSMCEMVGRYFCNCKYVEYFTIDLDFGRCDGYTEMGYELRGVNTKEKFVDFLFSLDAQDKS